MSSWSNKTRMIFQSLASFELSKSHADFSFFPWLLSAFLRWVRSRISFVLLSHTVCMPITSAVLHCSFAEAAEISLEQTEAVVFFPLRWSWFYFSQAKISSQKQEMYHSLKPHFLLAVHLTNLLQLAVSKNDMMHLCSPLQQYFMLVNAFMQSNQLYESAFFLVIFEKPHL